MGGALALLAAYDISRAMEWVSKPTKVICYTFGAPRVGNHAFAHTYDRMVPETWNIVNDQVRRSALPWQYRRRILPCSLCGDREQMLLCSLPQRRSKVSCGHVASALLSFMLG